VCVLSPHCLLGVIQPANSRLAVVVANIFLSDKTLLRCSWSRSKY